MSVKSFTQSTSSNQTYLSELADGPPFVVHGVALGADDITVGKSGVRKKWPADELRRSADTLQGTNLVVYHQNNASGVVGRVTKSGFKEGTGVIYEAELYDEEWAEKIQNGSLEVSIRGFHEDVDQLEEDKESEAKIVENIQFDNLSIVPTGASPSNTLQMGSHDELSAEELASFTKGLEELQEIEPGMWVKWDDNRGITISLVEDGEIEVDVYEKRDGQWRSTEETKMVDVDKLTEWDVDEEDIGPTKDEDDEDEEENASSPQIPKPEDVQLLYPTQEKAEEVAEMLDISESHTHQLDGETWYMPGEDHDVFIDQMNKIAEDEDGVSEMIDNLQTALREHGNNPDDSINAPDWKEGQLVRWQVNPEMFGKIVHIDEEKNIAMVEIHKKSDGNLESTGFTITAGFTDLIPFDRSADEMADPEPKFSQGDWVEWDSQNSTEIGKISGSYMEGDDLPDFRGEPNFTPKEGDILYGIKLHKKRDGEWHPVKDGLVGHYERSLKGVDEPSDVSDSPVELSHTIRVGTEFKSLINDTVIEVADIDGSHVHVMAEDGSKWWERKKDIRDKVVDGVWEIMDMSEEAEAIERGDWVKYRGVDNDPRFGQIVSIDQESNQMVATVRRFTRSGDKLDETEQKPVQGLDRWDGHPKSGESITDETEIGDMDMTTIMKLMMRLMEENATTTKDSPVEDAPPSHDSIDNEIGEILKLFLKNNDKNSTIADLKDWLSEENLRGEGEEEKHTSKQKRDNSREGEIWRFIDAEDEDSAELQERKFDDYPEAAKENAQMALDAREDTGNPNDCGTDVGWKRAKQLSNGEALTAKEVGKMSAFNRHRQNSDMDSDEGRSDCGWMMWKAWGGDEGVDWAKDKMDEIEEMAEELQDWEMHVPDWSGTTEKSWSRPDMEDFDTDDLSEIDDHFLISSTGFPPENFTDLALPVVEPNGNLNVNALSTVKGGRGATAVKGLNSDMEEQIMEWVNDTANEEFDRDWPVEEAADNVIEETINMVPDLLNMSGVNQDTEVSTLLEVVMSDVAQEAMEMFLDEDGKKSDTFSDLQDWLEEKADDTQSEGAKHMDEEDEEEMSGVRVLSSDDLLYGSKGESNLGSGVTSIKTMNDTIEAKLEDKESPVVVEEEAIEELRQKADQFEQMSESLKALQERTEILDEVDESQISELSEKEDPVVLESDCYEELQEEAEQVKGVYAAELSDQYEAFSAEELCDKFEISELREKFEDEIGEVAEELASSEAADFRSQDADESSLEEEQSDSAEELSAEVEQMQAQLKEKMDVFGGE